MTAQANVTSSTFASSWHEADKSASEADHAENAQSRTKSRFVRGVLTTVAAGAVIAATPGMAGASDLHFGAIAVSASTGGTGGSYDYASYADAEAAAMTVCGYTDCKTVVEFTNGCGAVAQASNGAWGWARGADLATAESIAVAQAVHQMHLAGYVYASAQVVDSVCTSGPESA